MLFYIVVLISLVMAAAVRIGFSLRRVSLQIKPLIVTVFQLLTAVGLILIVHEIKELNQLEVEKQWPSVEGIIISSEVIGERAYRPDITYKFSVNGVSYVQKSFLQMPAFVGRRGKYDAASKLAEMYPAGNTVRVFYNPENPDISRLKTGAPVQVYLRLSLAVFLLSAGVFMILAMFPRSK